MQSARLDVQDRGVGISPYQQSAFNDRRFVFAGGLLAGVCLRSLLWAPPIRIAIAGVGAAVVLWGFAVWTSLR